MARLAAGEIAGVAGLVDVEPGHIGDLGWADRAFSQDVPSLGLVPVAGGRPR